MRPERLKEIRQLRDLTQARLAELSKCSQQVIVDYEKGKSTPGAEVLMNIAKVLSVNPEYLTGHSDDQRRDVRLPDDWIQKVEKWAGEGLTPKELQIAVDMYQAALRRMGMGDSGKG